MSSVKLTTTGGNGGTVELKGPANTTSNAAVQLTLPVNDGDANQYLKTDGSGALSWATVSSTPEGTAILSTGESGGTKYLREDGDGTCSWQTVASAGGATGLDLNDNVKARFGTGNDLEIYHDGTDSFIKDTSTSLLINTDAFRLNNEANSENMIRADADGAVALYHDGTKVVETDANGFAFVDGKGITLGTDDDLKIYQSGTDTVFKRFVHGSLFFEDGIATATTAVPWRFGKTNNSATNNERHNMFSFGLPGVNRGLAQCGSSNSEAPIWAASSDYRIKENFRPYTGGWDAIKAIPVQLYDEKSPSYWTQGADKKDMKGWKAHEVQAVIPEAVTGTKDAVVTQALIDSGQYQQSELNHIIPQQLGTTAMLPDVIGALQQAMAKIETLETKVAALEAE